MSQSRLTPRPDRRQSSQVAQAAPAGSLPHPSAFAPDAACAAVRLDSRPRDCTSGPDPRADRTGSIGRFAGRSRSASSTAATQPTDRIGHARLVVQVVGLLVRRRGCRRSVGEIWRWNQCSVACLQQARGTASSARRSHKHLARKCRTEVRRVAPRPRLRSAASGFANDDSKLAPRLLPHR